MTACPECCNYNHNFCFARRFDEGCDCKCQTNPKIKKKYDATYKEKIRIKSERMKIKK